MVNTDLVIVSALITNINKYRNTADYINYGSHLLNNNISQVLFIEKAIFFQHVNTLIHIDGEVDFNHLTYESKTYEYIKYNKKIFVFFEKADIYFYDSQYALPSYELITDNPDKDTTEYMFVQCHKTEWVKMATQLYDGDDSTHEYMWIDFGIYHMFDDDELFYWSIQNLYNRVVRRPSDKIRAASYWSPEMYDLYSGNIYQTVFWLFAGSVFGGSAENMVRFAELTKTKCLQTIQDRRQLMWEVNIWALIYKENPDLFDLYNCVHDSTIINNY
jgi:hypothetical protein